MSSELNAKDAQQSLIQNASPSISQGTSLSSFPSTRRGSNNDAFDKEWSKRYQKCLTSINDLLLKLSETEKTLKKYGTKDDSLALRNEVDSSTSEIVAFITKLSIDIIQLSDLIDKELDLSIEQINNFEKYDSFDDVSPKLQEKKRAEMKLAKKFKETVLSFKLIQNKAVKKAKEFVLKVTTTTTKNNESSSAAAVSRRDKYLVNKKGPPVKLKSQADILQANIETLQDHLTEIPSEECKIMVMQRQQSLHKMLTEADTTDHVIIDMERLERLQSMTVEKLSRRNSKFNKRRWVIWDYLRQNFCWLILGASAAVLITLLATQSM